MRISEQNVYQRIALSTGAARARLDKASEPLVTGHKSVRPSDDPIHAQRMARHDRAIRRTQQYRNNIGRLQTYHQVVETTVTNVLDTLSELSSLAISTINGALGPNDQAAAAAEVARLTDALSSLGNAKFNGRHLFAGRTEDQPAYDAAGVFQGDAVGRTVPVADGLDVPGDVTGPTVFGQTGSSAFDAASALNDALAAGDSQAISDALGKINAAHSTAARALTDIGFRMRDLQTADSRHDDNQYVQQVQKSKLDEVDIGKAASEMAFAENVYQTAIQTAVQLNRILDKQTQL